MCAGRKMSLPASRAEPSPSGHNVSTCHAPAPKGRRQVWFDAARATDVPVFEREAIGRGGKVKGPAIVEQMDATTVIPADWDGEVDAFGNLILTYRGPAR